jgi:putative ABC transport system permease protein
LPSRWRWRCDLRADFFTPEPTQTLYGLLEQTEDIESWESTLTVPVQIQAGGIRLETVVEGISPESELLQPANMEGEIVRPGEGVVLPAALARQLGVEVGDRVRLQAHQQDAEIELPIEHITEGIGAAVFMRLAKAQSAFARPRLVNSLLIKTKVPSWQFRQSLQMLPQLARLQDMQDLRERINRIMDFNYLLITSMLLFSAMLGVAILFTTSTLNVWERRRELATMRAIGLPFRQIVGMVTLEHCLVGLMGVAVGIPLGIWAMRAALNLYEGSFLTLPLILKPGTFALAIANIFMVLLLAQWPVLRSIAHLNLADVVRERREG